MPAVALAIALSLSFSLSNAAADDNPTVAPADARPGEVHQWKAADGLLYEYRVPKGYDPAAGANLVLVLHGNGLDHRWTFWNHPQDEFRPDDLVVSPDGTTPLQANEFLGEDDDAARVHALITELKAQWNVRKVFLYGHSQGSFFAFYYAGEYPSDVDGVCGHASGVWTWTKASRKNHHQAIGVLHGTDDHIPYAQGWHGARWYREQGYPRVHLRTLFDWDHRPHWMQAASVLAWCEGVTSDDPARVAAALEELARPDLPMGANWSALWAVADRLSGLAGATPAQKKRARAVADAVDALAAEHAKSIAKGPGKKGRLDALSKGSWAGELIRFVEEFDGVPAQTAFLKAHEREIDALRKDAERHLRTWWAHKDSDPAEALAAGLALARSGFLDYQVPSVLEQCRAWVRSGAVELKKKAADELEELATTYAEARAQGFEAFAKRNAAAKL